MSIKKNIVVVYSTQVLTIAISFISSIFLARILGPAGRGEQAIFTNSMAFCGLFFGFSITSTITYFLNSGKIVIEKLFFSLLLFSFLTGLLLLLTLVVLNHFHILSLALPANYHHWFYIVVFAVSYFFTMYGGILNAFLTSYKIFKKQNLLLLIPNLILLGVYIMIYYGILKETYFRNFNLVVMAFLFSSVSTCFIMYSVFKREVKIKLMLSLLNIEEIRMFVKYSLLAYIGNVAQFLSYRMDIWTVDNYCGKASLGIYSQAIMLLQMLWILPNTLANILYSYASASGFEEVREKALRMIRIAFYSTLLLAIMLMLLSYFFIPLLFGKEFAGSVEIIFILSFGYIIFSIPSASASLFSAYGHFKVNYYIGVSVGIISVAMYLIMTKAFGLYGAAMASNISYTLSSLLCIIMLKKYFKFEFIQLFYEKNDIQYVKDLVRNNYRQWFH